MKMVVARVMVFAKDMAVMTAFYERALGLARIETEDDSDEFVSFDAGGCQLCLHAISERYAREIEIADPPEPREGTPIKVAFRADDVAKLRGELVSRGAPMGPVKRFGSLELCNGTDPEGNIFQLSNRE